LSIIVECKNFFFACKIKGKKASGKIKMGSTAPHIAIFESFVARKVFETKGANIATNVDMKRTINSLIKNEAFMYSLAFSCSPRAV